MASDDFRFKRFIVRHDRCAMKVGTDGVLLGTWADVAHAGTILDIGAGSGLVALICAQRSNAMITAVEIDDEAAAQAAENAAGSPWKDRIAVVHSSIEEFAAASGQHFDAIVSNPPYFENSYKAKGERRNLARHADMLTPGDLVRHAAALLADGGSFSCILPAEEECTFADRAEKEGLHLRRKTMVLPREGAEPKRVLFVFRRQQCNASVSSLAILKRDSNEATEEYKNLTRDFYLNF